MLKTIRLDLFTEQQSSEWANERRNQCEDRSGMKKILEHKSNHICIISSSASLIGNNYEVMEQIIVFQLATTNILHRERYLQHAYTPSREFYLLGMSWVIELLFPHALHFRDIESSFICAASSADLLLLLHVPVLVCKINQYIKMIWSTAWYNVVISFGWLLAIHVIYMQLHHHHHNNVNMYIRLWVELWDLIFHQSRFMKKWQFILKKEFY